MRDMRTTLTFIISCSLVSLVNSLVLFFLQTSPPFFFLFFFIKKKKRVGAASNSRRIDKQKQQLFNTMEFNKSLSLMKRDAGEATSDKDKVSIDITTCVASPLRLCSAPPGLALMPAPHAHASRPRLTPAPHARASRPRVPSLLPHPPLPFTLPIYFPGFKPSMLWVMRIAT